MLWILLVVYQIKHFIADYPLQGKYMLGKFAKFPDFVLPLLAHVAVHGVFTFAIAICLKDFKVAAALALLDMTIHFIVDRIKASPDLLGRFKAVTKKDYEEHLSKVNSLTEQMKSLSVQQETLAAAADIQAQINDEQVDWMERMKSNVFFWWALGWDQMMHHLTHYLIIWALLP